VKKPPDLGLFQFWPAGGGGVGPVRAVNRLYIYGAVATDDNRIVFVYHLNVIREAWFPDLRFRSSVTVSPCFVSKVRINSVA